MARSQRSALPVFSTYTPQSGGTDVKPAVNASELNRVFSARSAGGVSPSYGAGAAAYRAGAAGAVGNAANATAGQIGAAFRHTPFQNAFQKSRDRYRQSGAPQRSDSPDAVNPLTTSWGGDAGAITNDRPATFSTHGNADAGAVTESARANVAQAAQEVIKAGSSRPSGLVIPSVITTRKRR